MPSKAERDRILWYAVSKNDWTTVVELSRSLVVNNIILKSRNVYRHLDDEQQALRESLPNPLVAGSDAVVYVNGTRVR